MQVSVIRYRERLLRGLETLFSSATVLDVGCGDGSVWILDLFSSISSHTVGVDIRKSKRWGEEHHKNVDFIVADAKFLPFRNGAFSIAFTKDMLHHVERFHKALRELDRVSTDFILIIEANRVNPISYFHMVKLLGHEHLTRKAFFECLKTSFFSRMILVTSREAHIFPTYNSMTLNELFEFIEDFFEAVPVFRRFLSYNLALTIKNKGQHPSPKMLRSWRTLDKAA